MSPLAFLLEDPSQMPSPQRRLGDRRSRVRFEIVGQLWGSLEAVHSLTLLNLGRGGALLRSSVPLEPGSIHRLRLELDDHPADVEARVRRVTPVESVSMPERFLVGIEFLSVPPATLARIDRYVAERRDGEAPVAETR